MELIPYNEFAKLRLRDFCSTDVVESQSPDWEWMGGLWYCDSVGFTWFGRLRDIPNETGGLEIDFSELQESAWSYILSRLSLPLRAGMSYESIAEVLGTPCETRTFVPDRKTFEFKGGSLYPYRVSCTVQDEHGLIFLSVIREDICSLIGDV